MVVALFNQYEVMDYIMFGLGAIALVYILFTGFRLDKEARSKLFAALLIIVFSTLFWAFYEQNSGSLNLFAMRNVDMQVGVQLTSVFSKQLFAAGLGNNFKFCICLAVAFLKQERYRTIDPAEVCHFFLVYWCIFFVFYLGCQTAGNTVSSPCYLCNRLLFSNMWRVMLSPIGLSMVTKLAPRDIVALLMGIWFFASAVGEFLAGKIGSMMSVPPQVVDNPVLSLPYYADILSKIGLWSCGIGVLLICFVPFIRKWMSDVK